MRKFDNTQVNTRSDNRLRVVHVISCLNKELGGSILVAVDLACQLTLHSKVISNEIVSLGNSKETLKRNEDLIENLRDRNIPIHMGLSKRGNKYGFTKLKSILTNTTPLRNADVLVCHQIYTIGTFYSSIVCWVFRIPLIVIPHGSLTSYHLSIRAKRKNIVKPLIRIILKKSHLVITNSEQERIDLEAKFQITSRVIPYGADEQFFDQTKRRTSKSFNFIFVGRFTEKKQIPLIIKAFLKLARMYDDVHLTIVGDGEARLQSEIAKMVQSVKSGLIQLTGWVNKAELEQIYMKSHCLVLPSLDENFGLVITEALSFSIPCIVSKNVGLSNFISSYQAGSVLEVTDEYHLVQAMKSVYSKDHKSLTEAVKVAFQKEFHWPSIVSKWEEVLTLKLRY